MTGQAPSRRDRPLAPYRAACGHLLCALDTQSAARAAYNRARDLLDDARAAVLLAGGPGVPERASAELREAALARATYAEGQALRGAREVLRAAEATLEAARVTERLEREALRLRLGGVAP